MGLTGAYFLNRTPRFDWYVVWRGSKNKLHKDTCLKEIVLRLQILIMTLHSIVNTQLGGLMYHIKKSTNMHFQQPQLNQGRSNFQSDFHICFIVDLLVHHESCCVHPIDKSSRRTWKTNQITPTYLGCSIQQRWDPLYFTLPTTINSKHYITKLEILDGNVHLEEWWHSAPEWRCLQWSDLRSPQQSQRGRYLHQLIVRSDCKFYTGLGFHMEIRLHGQQICMLPSWWSRDVTNSSYHHSGWWAVFTWWSVFSCPDFTFSLKYWIPTSRDFILESTTGPMNTAHQQSKFTIFVILGLFRHFETVTNTRT